MLEQVGEAGAALGLGAEADVVVDGDADDGGGPVGGEQHPQPVVERGAVEVDGHGSTLTGGTDGLRGAHSGGSTTNCRSDRSG